MPQQQSQSGQVGFKTQAARGTFEDPGAAAPANGVFIRHRSGAMGGERELIIPDPEIGGNRDIPDATLGPIKFAGEYEMYARLEGMATLLKGALGQAASTSVGATYGVDLVGTHVITPVEDSLIPYLSVVEGIGDNYEDFAYTDARVDTFHLEADADGYLMSTVGLMALAQTAGNTRTDLTLVPEIQDTTPLIVGSEVNVTYNGLSLCAKSFNLDIANNMEDDDFCLGSVFADDITPKRREITMGLTIRPEDSALWRTAMYGGSGFTSAQPGASAKAAAQVSITSFSLIGATAVPYSLVIDIPVSSIQPFEVDPSGDDIIEHDLEIQAVRPDPSVPIITATIVNGLATVL